MKVNLQYGRDGLLITIPNHSRVIRSQFVPGVNCEKAAILRSLQYPIESPPLKDLVTHGNKVCIVHTDITRPTPNDRLLPVIIKELETAGINTRDIFLLNGLGTHRFQTETELKMMLGKNVKRHYHCIQHDARDDMNLTSLGTTSWGNPVRINRKYLEADVRILTGFIEPHFFAGFSGGPKAVLPALAGFESVWTNHSPSNIVHPAATWGTTRGNPIWEEMLEVALMTDPTFLVNIALNSERRITAVFAGNLIAAHAKGCEFVKKNTMVSVCEPYDIVITTNSGYPLDQNLYQSVKGMSAANRIVKTGGSIISVVACEDGVPKHGGYFRLLRDAGSPDDLLRMVNTPGFKAPDQWQVQIQAMIQKRADVYVYSDGLSDEEIQASLFIPSRDITATINLINARSGKTSSIAVLPEGPQTVPYLET